jgi:hypothetical protein
VLDKIGFLAAAINRARIKPKNIPNIAKIIRRDFIFANESGIFDKIYTDLIKRADENIAA